MDNIIPKEKAGARIDQSFKMVKNNFLYLFFLPLFFQLIFNLGGFFPLLKLEITSNPLLSVLTLIGIVLLGLFNTVLMIRIVSQIVKGEGVNFGKDLQFTLGHILSYVKAFLYVLIFGYGIYILLFLISIFLPIMNLIIGLLPTAQVAFVSSIFMFAGVIGMILKTYSLFPVYFILLTESLNPKESLKKSYEITKNKFGRTFGNFLFIILWLGIIKLAFLFLLGMFVNETVLGVLFGALTSGLIISFTFLLFKRYELENNGGEEVVSSSENEITEVKKSSKSVSGDKKSNGLVLTIVILVVLLIGVGGHFGIIDKISGSKIRLYDAGTIADVGNTAAFLQIYYDDNGKYPNSNGECLKAGKGIGKDIGRYMFGGKVPEGKNVDFKEDHYNGVCNKRGDIFYASLKKDNLNDNAFILCSGMYTVQKTNTSGDIFTALGKIKDKKYESIIKNVGGSNNGDYYCTVRP